METVNDFILKQRKYMPVFPKAAGKPTVYIEGYPYEDEVPMPATGFHGEQISIFYDQLSRYFAIHPDIYVGVDNFIYYREGDMTQCVAPDVYVVLGAAKYPLRRSFYTWSEGAVPTTVFEFLSDTTASEDREGKVEVYLNDVGVCEYFIHQPEMEKPAEFRGWRRDSSGRIVEILPDVGGGLFSVSLNLWFRYEARLESHVRLLRPFLPDGTVITTSLEEEHLRVAAEDRADAAEDRADAAEGRADAAEDRADAAEGRADAAAALAAAEAQRRQEIEDELERLRQQLGNR